MKRYLLIILAIVAAAIGLNAQIISSDPPILTQSSTNIVITYRPDADGSNKTLANLSSSESIYAHIGLITNESKSTSDWKYAPTWGTNTDKYLMKRVADNTYTLTIGDFASYFGVPDGVTVKQIAMVFRTADSKKEGKTSSGGDILYDVYADGFRIVASSTASSTGVITGTSATLTFTSTQPADLTLTLNDEKIMSKSNASELVYTANFTNSGKYAFVCTGTNANGESYSAFLTYNAISASPKATYPGGVPKMGAVTNSDGTVTFCLAAPNKGNVTLVPSWDEYQVLDKNVMSYQDYNGQRYFWITISGLDPDVQYPYYYQVDGTTRVGDPYAHLVLDPYNDSSLSTSIWAERPKYPSGVSNVMLAVYHGNQDKYTFSDFTIPDHRNLVIYELLFRDFTGTEGSARGNGTVKQAMAKIPYLKSLGVNAVELLPIMEFNGNNSWGYNTNFYMAPDKAYGSPTDYKDFVEECHKNGIAVILDIVFNQSDGLHPWYQMYPIASNPFYNKTAPHDYSVLNDWNQDNSLVAQQWEDAIRYWMTAYNVDGFRFDLVKGLGDTDSYGSGTEAYNQSRIDRMAKLHAVITSCKANGIHINENLAGSSEETKMANDGQLNWSNFSYNCTQLAKGASEGSSGGKLNQMYSGYGRPLGSMVSYAESHDEERMGYAIMNSAASSLRTDEMAARRLGLVAGHLIMTPGPKMIWQFGELGANQTTKSGSSNNTSPKKVIWSNLDNEYYAGLYNVYRELINMRMKNPDLFSSSASYTPKGMGGAMSTPRTIVLSNGTKEAVAFFNCNTSGDPIDVTATTSYLSASNSQLIVATYGVSPVLTGSGTVTVKLPANSMAVFATANVDGINDAVADIDSNVAVYGADGEIVIVGEYANAQAYTLQGMAVNRLTDLAAGIYIVRVDGKAFKVAVK